MRRLTVRTLSLAAAVVTGFPIIEALFAPAEACCHAGGARRESSGRNRATQPSRPPPQQRVVPRMNTRPANPAQRNAARGRQGREGQPDIALPPVKVFLPEGLDEPWIKYLDDGFYGALGVGQVALGKYDGESIERNEKKINERREKIEKNNKKNERDRKRFDELMDDDAARYETSIGDLTKEQIELGKKIEKRNEKTKDMKKKLRRGMQV